MMAGSQVCGSLNVVSTSETTAISPVADRTAKSSIS
jgi:hypothetical protein